MHFSLVLALLGVGGRVWAAPQVVKNPYTKDYRDPYDKKVDSYGDKLNPLPWRNGAGASILGPQNKERTQQNPDMMRPPSTDHGDMQNMRWSFADSHMRIEEGGWTRQTTIRELATSVQLAGVNMRLEAGVIRELHWHKEAEWAYVLEGSVRITALDTEGGSFVDDLNKGDLWYFPSGHPHSLQGLSPNGTEFLLIFDDGNFSEESTFLLTDWLAHTPKSVLAENFRVHPEVFNATPEKEKYIFQGRQVGSIDSEIPKGPGYKKSKLQFTHKMLAQKPLNTTGGQVRITDSTNFPLSKTVAAAHLNIQPGALREMHWHPNADEWSFFIKGRARVTIFASSGTARTFDFQAGDVGIVPANMGHFVENLSDDEDLEMLEIFRADQFQDFSLFQWLGETPQKMVVDHLFATDKKSGDKFLAAIKNAEKDEIKSVDAASAPEKDSREEL
ncbi:Bicupin, oxalate decarboxylase/oxidase [Bimuria novae-zelandiae CBS 107.79]|uniref:Bicupin, oxalate decarboxylase/oxidase n=1 Tax=Bimuria novae-zelandiae CBS 107.79 TaxID=1447943 RepID=A0A6A5UPW7_9PLEO|nr:Bicupin, oxalate decarboxylase/oxidase [Bimuria novae-zelandiae CBS 107.79]